MTSPSLSKRAVSEFVGTALLLATVVGSGIMGEKLAGGNIAVALLANTVATGAGLVAFIQPFQGRAPRACSRDVRFVAETGAFGARELWSARGLSNASQSMCRVQRSRYFLDGAGALVSPLPALLAHGDVHPAMRGADLLDDGEVAQGHRGDLRVVDGLLGCAHGGMHHNEDIACDGGHGETNNARSGVGQRREFAREWRSCERRTAIRPSIVVRTDRLRRLHPRRRTTGWSGPTSPSHRRASACRAAARSCAP